MKQVIFITLCLCQWATPAWSFGLESNCSRSFDSNAKVATYVKVSPSIAVSRGRYELEEFVAETVGQDFMRDHGRIKVELSVSKASFDDVLDQLSALGINPVVSEDVPSDDLIITVFANSRDLVNLLREFTPNSYFVASTYDPRRAVFGLEI